MKRTIWVIAILVAMTLPGLSSKSEAAPVAAPTPQSLCSSCLTTQVNHAIALEYGCYQAGGSFQLCNSLFQSSLCIGVTYECAGLCMAFVIEQYCPQANQ